MSKFLGLSKTSLPMVLQKSTSDAIQILQKYPSLSTAQHEELAKQDALKEETPKQDSPKQDLQHQETSKQISLTPKEKLKIFFSESPEILSVDSGKILDEVKSLSDKSLECKIPKVNPLPDKSLECKIPKVVNPLPDKSLECKIPEVVKPLPNPESLKVISVSSESQKTLFKALILDLLQVQRALLVLLSEGRMRLWLQSLGIRAGPGASGELQMKQPKEREPVLLSVSQKKTEPKAKQKRDEKAEDKPPIKSNLWEAVQENSPAWQKSISKQMGELQQVIVEKLSK